MENWEAISKKVYWDRDVPLEKWREKVSAGHRSYLPDAVMGMTPVEFVGFYGVEKFRSDWPALRAALTLEAEKRAAVYDLAWSRIVGGGWNLKPTGDFFDIPERRRAFLIEVSRRPGESIYEVAQVLGMQYRRAHDHYVRLVNDGKIMVKETMEGGRWKKKLFPVTTFH